MNLDNWDPRTKPGMEGKQGRARQEIDGLKMDITAKVLANSSTVLVLRDVSITPDIVAEARKFPENVIVLDFLSLEKGMFTKIFGKNTNLPFNTETISRMNSLMVDVGDKLQVLSMPTITADAKMYGTVSSKEEMIEKMEKVLADTYETQLKKIFLSSQILDNMNDKFNNDSVAVFIVNAPADGKFLQALSSYTSRTIIASEDENMAGAVILKPESSAAELVNAVAQVTSATGATEKKPVRRSPRAKPTNGEQA